MEINYNAQGRLDMLKQRVERCVCRKCGGKLYLKMIHASQFADTRVEIFCEHCDRIEFGVEPEIYYCAKYYVDYLRSSDSESETSKEFSVSQVCDILAWGCKYMNLMNKNGFLMPVKIDKTLMSNCNILTIDDVQRLSKEESPGEK